MALDTTDGRHWQLAGTDVFLEAPGATLDRDTVITKVELDSGRTANVVSRIDILLDRLDEFQATGHRIVAQQILVLLAQGSAQETSELSRRARERRVAAVLAALTRLAVQIGRGGDVPETDELHEIARNALRTEYHR